MASKRALYKPATLQEVGSHEQRRGLAQGRLVSKPVLPNSMTVFASPRDLNPNTSNTDTADVSVTLPHCGYPVEGTVTPPRQLLASVETRHGPQTAASISPRQSKVSLFNGQSGHAEAAGASSPSKPTPSASLELSDAEIDPSRSASKSPVLHVRHLTPSPVLYVDASGGLIDPDRSEVETNTGLVISPVKVVCHAPAVVESDLRDSGYTQEAARIKVDAVPTVSLLGDLDVTQVKGDRGSSAPLAVSASKGGARTPLVVKGNALAGIAQDMTSALRIDDASRDEDETVPRTIKTESTQKDKKKKKATIVPSRYMQAATKTTSAGSSSVRESTTFPPRPQYGSSTATSRGGPNKKAVKSSHPKRTVSVSAAHQPVGKQRSQSSRQSHYSYTPVPRGMHRGGGVTSTPAVNASVPPSAGSLDASAIGASMVQGPDASMAMAPASGVAMSLADRLDSAKSLSHHEDLSAADTSVFQSGMSSTAGQDSAYASFPTTHRKKRASDITQDYLDRSYARYTQALFLDSKVEKTLKEQEKEAMSQMYGLWHENEKLRARKQELELELTSSRHANRLDQQLDVQIGGLGPVVAHLDQLKKQYSTLAHALDTTRHQLGTAGIHIPQDEDSYHELLISALAESENLLGEINAATRTHQPKVTSFASAIHALQKAVENEDKELKRCQELLAATSTLATQESSLRIQQIEQ
ncbi:uncharacterized protein LOC110977066 isoform X2 [Acanthaster planci]|uniref:Uncharacterized protein LOC110977066 isoform X2 n=1 Tax=Acanthaster planci TaxID=133434 RepID=A0A8B7Y2M3_ACAPL|nr:uncharacterized protein LOC110977066 isoform X2 [Acanthaster planci]XP_022086555.1 uncharacterized protein LOC110977066 isoform X2 [Acanthaster planci]